jgi:hypothetical protein
MSISSFSSVTPNPSEAYHNPSNARWVIFAGFEIWSMMCAGGLMRSLSLLDELVELFTLNKENDYF